jgi:hypothetical protein
MGKNTAASVTDIDMTAKNISLDPFIAVSMGVIPSSTFLEIFSVTTIPSSTTILLPSTIANNVNTFMENQKSHMIRRS